MKNETRASICCGSDTHAAITGATFSGVLESNSQYNSAFF